MERENNRVCQVSPLKFVANFWGKTVTNLTDYIRRILYPLVQEYQGLIIAGAQASALELPRASKSVCNYLKKRYLTNIKKIYINFQIYNALCNGKSFLWIVLFKNTNLNVIYQFTNACYLFMFLKLYKISNF